MRSIPVTILAGSDRKAAHLPQDSGLHALTAVKAVALKPLGRPLIQHLVERLTGVPGLGPLRIAGPAALLAPLGLEAELIDTDRSAALNLRAAIERHLERDTGPMAVMACDVLPGREELVGLRALYERQSPCALWFPFVRVPEDPGALGACAWKPTYRLRADPGALRILPGHLGIFEPQALRLPLLYRLLDLTYRTRNRSVAYRRAVMVPPVLLALLGRDLLGLLRLQAPTLTVSILRSGLRLARDLRAGRLSLGELETLIGRIFLRRSHAALPPQRGIRYPLVDVLSLAQDVDTEEEARWLEGRLAREGRTGG